MCWILINTPPSLPAPCRHCEDPPLPLMRAGEDRPILPPHYCRDGRPSPASLPLCRQRWRRILRLHGLLGVCYNESVGGLSGAYLLLPRNKRQNWNERWQGRPSPAGWACSQASLCCPTPDWMVDAPSHLVAIGISSSTPSARFGFVRCRCPRRCSHKPMPRQL
jgi:hypothetical protein